MPATIVETNTKKFKRKDIDPITLDIIENAMMNARYEMDAVVFRTAMSPGIREQGDEFGTSGVERLIAFRKQRRRKLCASLANKTAFMRERGSGWIRKEIHE